MLAVVVQITEILRNLLISRTLQHYALQGTPICHTGFTLFFVVLAHGMPDAGEPRSPEVKSFFGRNAVNTDRWLVIADETELYTAHG